MAGVKGTLVSLLADYNDLRERVQEVRKPVSLAIPPILEP